MLLSACEKCDKTLISSLLSTEDLEQRDNSGSTPLILACHKGNTEVISLLLSAGSNIESCNNVWQTPLFISCWCGHLDAVSLLIDSGANVNHQDKRGWTPLMIAVYQDHESIVRMLIEKGCDPEKKDCFNKQALDRAKSLKMMEIVKKAVSEKRKRERKGMGSGVIRSTQSTPKDSPRSGRSSGSLLVTSPRFMASKNQITPNFRKTFKEKIDKRIRDTFFSEKNNFCGDYPKLFVNILEDEKSRVSEEIRLKVQEMTRAKTWDLFGKLQKFSVELLNQARPKRETFAPSEESHRKDETIRIRLRETVKDEISKSLELGRSELQGFIQSYIEKEFYRIEEECVGGSRRKGKLVVEDQEGLKKKSQSNVPQFDVCSSLKGFLRSENIGGK